MILPILLYNFNIGGIYFLITNLLVSMIIGSIVITGFSSIIMAFMFKPLAKIIAFFLNFGIDILKNISKLSKLPLAKIYLPTPSFFMIILYFASLAVVYFLYPIYRLKKPTQSQKRVKNIIALFHYKFNQKRSKYIMCIIIIIAVCICVSIVPKDLKIYFVDVGQGDCTFIVTPTNKTIFVDGGGSLNKDFDVGKQTVLPYLLDKGYNSLDYIIISHFDQDHVQALLYVMQEINVRNVIIGKQFETCENYEEFKKIVREKNINVKVVEAGTRISIEKDLYFDVLWPCSNNIISENNINNNSLVAKLMYKDFSVLFTGDIEEVAEKAILEKYEKHLEKLKSTVLKVPHHGSKTSSTQEFLNAVKPQVALIGVGKNNTFGHPNDLVLERLKRLGMQDI